MKIKLIAFLVILFIGFNAKANLYKVTVGINDCNDISNLCVGDTLRFSGDSSNVTVYGVISGYVYNSTTLNYDSFSVTSFTGIETTYDHIIASGDDKFWLDLCAQEYNLYLNGCIITGEKEISQEQGINIYPNPNLGQFTISYNLQGTSSFRITDLTGKIVHQELLFSENRKQAIITNKLNTGIYFLEILSEKKSIYRSKIYITN
jgi:Secretion system C-terminal sorting domain